MFVTLTLFIALTPTSIPAKNLYLNAIEYLQEIKIKFKPNAYGASFTRTEKNNLNGLVPEVKLSKLTNSGRTVITALQQYNQESKTVVDDLRTPLRKYYDYEESSPLFETLGPKEKNRVSKNFNTKAKSPSSGSSDEECEEVASHRLMFKDRG